MCATLLKSDSNTGVFLLQNFQDHLFYKTSANG